MKGFFNILASSTSRGNIDISEPVPEPGSGELRLKEYYYDGRNYFNGAYQQNPVTGNFLHVFANGTQHSWTKERRISGKRSIDEGETHGDMFEVTDGGFTDTGKDLGIQDLGGGYDSNGRFHLFYDAHASNESPTAQHYFRYQYSDDDGLTWSDHVLLLDLAGSDLWVGRTYGKMIENNGILMKPYYRGKYDGNIWEMGYYRSEDYGTTWNMVEITTSNGEFFTETNLIAVGNNVLCVIRNEEEGNAYQFHVSNDNGITWSFQGESTLGEVTGRAHPPHLAKFKINGQDVLCFYFFNRTTLNFMAIYGKPADVFAGISGWNLNTKTIFFNVGNNPFFLNPMDEQPGGFSGYMRVQHINDELFAKGMIYPDYSADTAITYFDLPTTHYQTIINELGL